MELFALFCTRIIFLYFFVKSCFSQPLQTVHIFGNVGLNEIWNTWSMSSDMLWHFFFSLLWLHSFAHPLEMFFASLSASLICVPEYISAYWNFSHTSVLVSAYLFWSFNPHLGIFQKHLQLLGASILLVVNLFKCDHQGATHLEKSPFYEWVYKTSYTVNL